MFENILEEFKKLTTAVDFLSEANAKDLVDFISRQLMEELGAYTVDALWKEPANGGIYLKALWSDSKSRRGSAKGRFINQETHGIWSKLYRDRTAVWIEGIQGKECIKSAKDGGADKTLEEGYIRLTESVKIKEG